MLGRILGKKIGMTQIFTEEGKVVPVTVINTENWFVTQIKTLDSDGYSALQLGLLKDRYIKEPIGALHCKNKKKYFSFLREVDLVESEAQSYKLGQKIDLNSVDFGEKGLVKVTGNSKGLGFQGVVKRWGFAGGPRSHGSNFHRIPGSVGNMCSQGKVIKGQKMPGQFGNKQVTIKGLKVVKQDNDGGYLFVKGAVPGKKGSLLIISRQG